MFLRLNLVVWIGQISQLQIWTTHLRAPSVGLWSISELWNVVCVCHPLPRCTINCRADGLVARLFVLLFSNW